jgi:DNA-binding NarL/FixJ family response regulator
MQTGGRVIVADDHRQMLQAAESILRERFDVVAAVSSGAAAIDAAGQHDPDVVVLDIAMPGLDGFATAARLRAAGTRARIVFLSNHTGDDFVLAGIDRGASAFVAKARMAIDLADAVEHVQAGRMFMPSARLLRQGQRPPSHRHDLQFYSTDAFLVESVMELFETALDAGDSIIAVASAAHRAALESLAGARGVAFDALTATGRCTLLDAQATLDAIMVDGRPDGGRFVTAFEPIVDAALAASTGSPPHVTMFGEIAPILCARGAFDDMLRLERVADEFVAARPLSLLCAYHASPQTDAGRVHVCAGHSTIVASES